MTVEELIIKLQAVEDKSLEIVFEDEIGTVDITEVSVRLFVLVLHPESYMP